MAVASAAETAVASALQVNVSEISISVQSLYFCGGGTRPVRTCSSGWSLLSALQQLQEQAANIPKESCLPYTPDASIIDSRTSELCKASCSDTSKLLQQGGFAYTVISSAWEAQKHIREWGGVLSRFNVYDDFKNYNKGTVYVPRKGAQFLFGHAIVLVGRLVHYYLGITLSLELYLLVKQ
eukprot:GHUV01033277.1.p1 GENE.GHUV01033277.1~~GHUV01033277.1.p1  ORF type:complete len:181 (-),score=37.54 GHUV01033277.1:58-600(-)